MFGTIWDKSDWQVPVEVRRVAGMQHGRRFVFGFDQMNYKK